MERDFMGLNSKEPLAVVKEEIAEAPSDSGNGCSGVPWSFMNNVSAAPHFMPFKTGQEDRTKKMVDAFHCSQVFSAAEVQSLQRVSVPDQTSAFPVNNASFKANVATSGQNLVGATMMQQFIGGVPTTSSLGPVVGITEPWNNFKFSTAPCQMTIFYAGTVCAYDDIPPDKARAIMLLAGNGSSLPSNVAHQRPQVQAPNTKLAAADNILVNQPLTPQPCPGLAKACHLSVSSHDVGQSGCALGAKITSVPTAPVSKPEAQVANALPQIALKAIIPSAAPQCRKASLARFLEKRKERLMNAAPYNCEKRSSESAVPGNNDISLSATSAVNSESLSSAGKRN